MLYDSSDEAEGAEVALAARAAWLYHMGKLRQVEVAEKLGISLNKANRLIAIAEANGTVQVHVGGPIAGCIGLEQELSRRFDLSMARVVPDLTEKNQPFSTVGKATAMFLHTVLEAKLHKVIGIGHGRTMAAAAPFLNLRQTTPVEFVSLLGSVQCRIEEYPFDLIMRLTERTGSRAYIITAPIYANNARDRAVLLRQRSTALGLSKAAEATLFLFGIGSIADKNGTDVKVGTITSEDLAEAQAAGAVGEFLGRYFDAAGKFVSLSLHDRVLALDPEAMRGRQAVAVASGTQKAPAILAALRSGIPNGLITTENTARKLLARHRQVGD